MKIQLNSNGQIIDPPLRVAQRYINLGRGHEVKEIKPKEEIVEVDLIEPIPEQFVDFEE